MTPTSYLYGWPSQQLAFHLGIGTTPAANVLFASVMALALAFLSWELVERPMLRLKGRVA